MSWCGEEVEGEEVAASGGPREGEGDAKEALGDEMDTQVHGGEEETAAGHGMCNGHQQQQLEANEATSPAGGGRCAAAKRGRGVEHRERGEGDGEGAVRVDMNGLEVLTCEEVLEGQLELQQQQEVLEGELGQQQQQQQEALGGAQIEEEQQQQAGAAKCGGTLEVLTGVGSDGRVPVR